jgi:hypothetical protein
VTNEIDLVDVGWVVVEDQLGCEVVVTRSLGIELKADDTEALSIDHCYEPALKLSND